MMLYIMCNHNNETCKMDTMIEKTILIPNGQTVDVRYKQHQVHNMTRLLWAFMQHTKGLQFDATDNGVSINGFLTIAYRNPYLLSATIAPLMQIEGLSYKQGAGDECTGVFSIHGDEVLYITVPEKGTAFNAGWVIDAIEDHHIVTRAALLSELTMVMAISKTVAPQALHIKCNLVFGSNNAQDFDNDAALSAVADDARESLVVALADDDKEQIAKQSRILSYLASCRRVARHADGWQVAYYDGKEQCFEFYSDAFLTSIGVTL